jgi:hypothetical protein
MLPENEWLRVFHSHATIQFNRINLQDLIRWNSTPPLPKSSRYAKKHMSRRRSVCLTNHETHLHADQAPSGSFQIRHLFRNSDYIRKGSFHSLEEDNPTYQKH